MIIKKLNAKAIIKGILKSFGFEINRLPSKKIESSVKELNFNDFLRVYISSLNSKENFFFIQIGSNDGVTYDPLHNIIQEFELDGLLVEPQKEIFKRVRTSNRRLR